MCKAKCRLHNKLKRVERGKIMLVAKKEAVKIDVANKFKMCNYIAAHGIRLCTEP